MLCKQCGGLCCRYVTIPLRDITDATDISWFKARGRVVKTKDGYDWHIQSDCRFLCAGKCAIYNTRPSSCKSYEVDGAYCRQLRKALK